MLKRDLTEKEEQVRSNEKEKVKTLQENDICPTCYNIQYGGVYEDLKNDKIYENELFIVIFEKYPRNDGHIIAIIKEHYEDISQMPMEIGVPLLKLTKAVVDAMKSTLKAEKIYVYSICDGLRNHMHVHFIPRYIGDICGSKMFKKKRGMLVRDENIMKILNKEIEHNLKTLYK